MAKNIDKYILKVSEWETPATRYPIGKIGSAEICRGKYDVGLYMMEGVGGYAFFHVLKPIPITILKIDGEEWMVDDPLHWVGMQLLAKHCKGRTLIGGLGLGLILHALCNNRNVELIDVYEINKDVIELISPFLPKDDRVKIINDDVFNSSKEYDTIILDLWQGGRDFEMLTEMLYAWVYFKEKYPNTNVYVWGVTEPEINPAVDFEARKIFEKNVGKLLRK